MGNNGKRQNQLCGYKFCRGTQGACQYSLVNKQALLEDLNDVVIKAIAAAKENQTTDGRKPHHPGLRISIAACPNACTEPQTKDVGIIAVKVPTDIGPGCNGCGRCRAVCREGAIKLVNAKAQLVPDRCAGCGQCISECPIQVIGSEPVRFRVLVAGRMGRHPRWAEQLCIVDGPDVVEAIQGFLDRLSQLARPGERAASVAERIGMAGLRVEKSINV